ncbi:hypothetical protein [Streptomyces canus]|nr:hypothetical protein [Streptomyces canus]
MPAGTAPADVRRGLLVGPSLQYEPTCLGLRKILIVGVGIAGEAAKTAD